jgi:hypothetical protein
MECILRGCVSKRQTETGGRGQGWGGGRERASERERRERERMRERERERERERAIWAADPYPDVSRRPAGYGPGGHRRPVPEQGGFHYCNHVIRPYDNNDNNNDNDKIRMRIIDGSI